MPQSLVHQLNCAKLMPTGQPGQSNPCSCGAEAKVEYAEAVHNHGPDEGRGLDCPETELANGRRVGACLNVSERQSFPDDLEGVPYIARSGEKIRPTLGEAYAASVRAGTVPPVDSEGLGAILARWWYDKSEEEAQGVVPKATEYGGAHRASDLIQLGRTIAELMGFTGAGRMTEGELQELACYFYLQGKVGRWHAALLEGRRVSDDTLLDIAVYTKMVQRIREVGGWPV